MRRLLRFIRGLRKRSHVPLVEVFVRRSDLLRNFDAFQHAYPAVAIAPVLKSNAYGHGLVPVASILTERQVPFLCVDSLYEARVLRGEGIQTPLLVIGYTPLQNVQQCRLRDVAFSILSVQELRMLAGQLPEPRTFHLKVDTGMHRYGILPEELAPTVEIIRKDPNIRIQGAFSHLADADDPGSPMTERQVSRWNQAVALLRRNLPDIKYSHLGATAGSAYSGKIDANVVRLGLGLYGVDAMVRQELDLRPVLEVRSRVSSLRTIAPGEAVGYNATFVAHNETKVATVPAGYYEGVDRRLSGNGSLLVEGVPCPIVGRVSMNVTSIDVTGVPDVRLGCGVVIISADPNAANSAVALADRCSTIPYEILVHIPPHLRRSVI